ncbi:hypothetical protein B0H14DRAFT_2420419 [Mycena olivaceomarginata]|nr:hypothetical protein B0H14DRAFT_2420419 [Mycena olivaceomarginata]
MYVDDGRLYVSSKSLETNIAYIRTRTALKREDLDTDDVKRGLQHSTCRPSDRSPAIRLPNADGPTETTITTVPTVKWLGVYFDRRLSFKHHVKTLAGRAANMAVNGPSFLLFSGFIYVKL